MEAFLFDWGVSSHGHLDNIMEPGTPANQARREVGIGIASSNIPGFGPMVITQDFASRAGARAVLLGVVYNDPDHSKFYAPGQGVGDVTITAVNEATGEATSVQTWDSGGYQMELAPGRYRVTATKNGQVLQRHKVSVGDVNVKYDFDLDDPLEPSIADPGAGSTGMSVAPQVAPVPIAATGTTTQVQNKSTGNGASPSQNQDAGSRQDSTPIKTGVQGQGSTSDQKSGTSHLGDSEGTTGSHASTMFLSNMPLNMLSWI